MAEYRSSRAMTAEAVAASKPKPPKPVPVAPSAEHHNRILRAGYKRADDLEARMVRVLAPILRRAGRDAAANFTARATSHLAAAGKKPPPSVTPEELKARTQAVEDAKAKLRTALHDGSGEQHVEAVKQELRDAQANLYRASARNPVWTAPAPAEVLDVDALVLSLRTKTEPVRQAMVQAVARQSIEQAGVAFDVSNPYVRREVENTASQITHIAQTTQANVAKIVQASYEQGLSIPDTAKAIRVGMAEQSMTRATLIARTTLAGATNGGSLAATQAIVAATGGTASYAKTWMTAPGATYPRHELVDGLDGQQQPLDQPFDVDGEPMMYPGDPSASPENCCNCRCTLSYADGTEVSADDAG